MKSKIIKILLFLFIGLECLALTNRERIEKDLRKLNINDSKIIAQTITIDEKIGDKLLQGEGVEVLLKDLKSLVAENPKNFYISYQIARYYLETEKNIEEVKKNKKYFDLYIENVPQEDEKLSMKMLYYEKVGDKENFKKYYDKFFKKTSGKGLGVLARTKYKKDAAGIKKDFALALDLFKKAYELSNHGWYLYCMGRCLRGLEKYEEAIKVLLESRQISIDKNDVVDGEDFELAYCYIGIGDKENAQKYLDSARDSVTQRGVLNDYIKEKIEEIEKGILSLNQILN